MKNLTFFLALSLAVFLQIAWGQWLNVGGFPIPLSLALLLLGIKWINKNTLLILAFIMGLLYDLLAGSGLGLMAVVNLGVVGTVLVLVKRR